MAKWSVVALLGVGLAVFIGVLFSKTDPMIIVPENEYFGRGAKHSDDVAVRKFKIAVADAVLEDLRSRLLHARIGHEQLEDVPTLEYGVNIATLFHFADYWRDSYDWRKQEELLNKFDQFTTEIEGLKIHFIHVKPQNKPKKVVPILLVHGWPGSIYEFYKLIPLLTNTDNDIAFEVIVPSIPGYGFSEQPHKRGFSQVSTARIFTKLMDRLKLGKFIAHGTDWGQVVVGHMARLYPDKLYGVHIDNPFVNCASLRTTWTYLLGKIVPSYVYANPEKAANWSISKFFRDLISETGYLHLQATRPDTVGVALNDSPIGLLAYILEKYSLWTKLSNRFTVDGGLEKSFTKDELLTTVTIYWVNGNIVSSQRYYRESFLDDNQLRLISVPIKIPTGFLSAANDIFDPPPLELFGWAYNVTHYHAAEEGGHFLALEKPNLVAAHIFKFTNTLKF